MSCLQGSDKSGVYRTYQLLTVNGHLLQPGVPLKLYHIEDGVHVNLAIKGLGGGGGQTNSAGRTDS